MVKTIEQLFPSLNTLLMSIVIFISFVFCEPQENNPTIVSEISIKVNSLIQQALNESILEEERFKFIDSAYIKASQIKNDSLISESLKQYIKIGFRTKNWEVFYPRAQEHLDLTQKTKDSSSYAKTCEYMGSYFIKKDIQDSAFYYYEKSFKMFDALKDSTGAGRILINRAIIEKNIRNYSASIETSILALKYLKSADSKRWNSSLYNNLGSVYNQIRDKENALKFHNIALTIRKQITSDPHLQLHSLNNIGRVYQNNEEFSKAISYYEQALTYDDVLQKHPYIYSMLLDNHAYSQFRIGIMLGVLEQMEKALTIREQEGNTNGIIINCIHLAEYYLSQNNTQAAIEYSKRAEELSYKIQNYRDYLESLELLGNLESGTISKEYFNRNLKIRDSLNFIASNHQKAISEMFFELEEAKKKKEKQEQLKKRGYLIALTLLISCLALIVLYSKSFKKSKKKQIELTKLKKDLLNVKRNGDINDEVTIEFHSFLEQKYDLTSTPALLEYWWYRFKRYSKSEISERLFISPDSVDDRKKRLIKKIHLVNGSSKAGRLFLADLYEKEYLDFFKL